MSEAVLFVVGACKLMLYAFLFLVLSFFCICTVFVIVLAIKKMREKYGDEEKPCGLK